MNLAETRNNENSALLRNSTATKSNTLEKILYGTGLVFGLAFVAYQGVSTARASSGENPWPTLVGSIVLLGTPLFGLIRAFSDACAEKTDIDNQAKPITESQSNSKLAQISNKINRIVGLIQKTEMTDSISINLEEDDLLSLLNLIEEHLQKSERGNTSTMFPLIGSTESLLEEFNEPLEGENSDADFLQIKIDFFVNNLSLLEKILSPKELSNHELERARSLITKLLKSNSASGTSTASSSAINSTQGTPLSSPMKK